jgi:hypothetical protein
MGFFKRRIGAADEPKRASFGPIDVSLPDDQWFVASEQAFKDRVEPYYGTPETMAEGGREHYGRADFGVALFFYRKAVDMLHTAYGFSNMESRQPSPADAWIVDGFCSSLGASLQAHPQAPVAKVAGEMVGRLGTIAADCDRVGIPAKLYRDAQDTVASTAPA